MKKRKTLKKHKLTDKELTVKRLLGRPSKYKKRYAQELIDYFNVDATVIVDGKEKAVRFPTLERFSIKIGVFVDTLADWANAKYADGTPKYPDFLRAYMFAKAMQKDILVANGMSGLYASNFATFVAVNFTDMADKKEVDATSKGARIVGFNYIVPEKPADEEFNRDSPDNQTNI